MPDFNTIDFQDWILKVKKELKLDELDVKHILLENGQNFNPFFDRQTKHEKHITHYRTKSPWKIGEVLYAKKHNNQDVLAALAGGAESLLIKEAEAIQDLSVFFKDVIFEYIDIHFEVSQISAVDFRSRLELFFDQKKEPFQCSIRLTDQASKLIQSSSKEYQFCIQAESTQNSLPSILRQAKAYLAQNTLKGFQECVRNIIVQFPVISKPIEQVAQMEAFRVTWGLICQSFGEEVIMPNIEMMILEEENDSNEENYIANSIKILTSAICSPDQIFVQASKENASEFRQRINRNTQHLLKMESFIDETKMVYKGSYVVHQMANQIAKDAWKKI